MAGWYDHTSGTMYTCIDELPDILHGGHTNKNGKPFYYVEAQCGSLKYLPYFEGRQLLCAVSSKE